MTPTFDELDHSIYKVLRTEGPLPTSDVAERVGGDRAKVYRRLRRLERLLGEGDGRYLGSRREPGERKLYWFPVTGEVLTAQNQELADELLRGLRAIVDSQHIPRGAQITEPQKAQLKSKFRSYVRAKAKELSSKQRDALRRFWAQLEIVVGGTTKSDIVGLFGMRSFHPEVRVWEVESGAPPDLPGF